jgi:uncharacterized membrane protein (GlpM family)
MAQLIIRFMVGGLVVSLFAALGDVLKPKSFAGLFGAAPSVALATLGLTVVTNGRLYASVEARSMIAGAVAFCLYADICCRLMTKRFHAAQTTGCALLVWLVCALGIWEFFLK